MLLPMRWEIQDKIIQRLFPVILAFVFMEGCFRVSGVSGVSGFQGFRVSGVSGFQVFQGFRVSGVSGF